MPGYIHTKGKSLTSFSMYLSCDRDGGAMLWFMVITISMHDRSDRYRIKIRHTYIRGCCSNNWTWPWTNNLRRNWRCEDNNLLIRGFLPVTEVTQKCFFPRRSVQRNWFYWLFGKVYEWSCDRGNHHDWRDRRTSWGRCCRSGWCWSHSSLQRNTKRYMHHKFIEPQILGNTTVQEVT